MDTLVQVLIKYIWTKSLSNEWVRLLNDNDHGVASINTIEYIESSQVPTDRKVTYASFVCDHRPLRPKHGEYV